MFNAVSEAERDAITVLVFLATFFVTLGIGRFLKRRAGVRLGLLFRLFGLILAFYAAIVVYGVHTSWRHHVGAAAILLSTALVVALINRYVWDFYFEHKRQTPIPHFLREVVGIGRGDRKRERGRSPAAIAARHNRGNLGHVAVNDTARRGRSRRSAGGRSTGG